MSLADRYQALAFGVPALPNPRQGPPADWKIEVEAPSPGETIEIFGVTVVEGRPAPLRDWELLLVLNGSRSSEHRR